MIALRPIPRALLPSTMQVMEPSDDGTFGPVRTIEYVRFDRVHAVSGDDHRADAVTGMIFVDAVNSTGAFEIPAGSRVLIDSVNLLVKSCARFEGLNGRVHPWELAVA